MPYKRGTVGTIQGLFGNELPYDWSSKTADWTSSDWLNFYNDATAYASSNSKIDQWRADYVLENAMNQYNAALENERNAQQIEQQNFANKLALDQYDESVRQFDENQARLRSEFNQNHLLDKQKFAYQTQLQEEIFERDDTQYQRAVDDMRKAGLSGLAFSPDGSNTVGSISGGTAPSVGASGTVGSQLPGNSIQNNRTSMASIGSNGTSFLSELGSIASVIKELVGSGADIYSRIKEGQSTSLKSEYQNFLNELMKDKVDWWKNADDETKNKIMESFFMKPVDEQEKMGAETTKLIEEAMESSSRTSKNLEEIPQIRTSIEFLKNQNKQLLKESEARVGEITARIEKLHSSVNKDTSDINQATSNIMRNTALTQKERTQLIHDAQRLQAEMQQLHSQAMYYDALTKGLNISNEISEHNKLIREYQERLDYYYKQIDESNKMLGGLLNGVLEGAKAYRYIQGF